MVYDTYNELVNGIYKPTYNQVGFHIVDTQKRVGEPSRCFITWIPFGQEWIPFWARMGL
jgi:hypothetical protein